MRTITDSFNVTKVNMLVELYTTTGAGGGGEMLKWLVLKQRSLMCSFSSIHVYFAY